MALRRCDDMMNRILLETGSDKCQTFISGPDNFRYRIDPQYKANRVDTKRPEWLQAVREHLVVNWGAHVSDGIEADDNLGIHQTGDTIICSIDKDLLQIPGSHYNFVHQTPIHITEHQGWVNFYTQLIMGDRSDNIPGYDGKMRQTVPKFLQEVVNSLSECPTPLEMYEVVWDLYQGGAGPERMHINAQLLYIQRQIGGTWPVPE